MIYYVYISYTCVCSGVLGWNHPPLRTDPAPGSQKTEIPGGCRNTEIPILDLETKRQRRWKTNLSKASPAIWALRVFSGMMKQSNNYGKIHRCPSSKITKNITGHFLGMFQVPFQAASPGIQPAAFQVKGHFRRDARMDQSTQVDGFSVMMVMMGDSFDQGQTSCPAKDWSGLPRKVEYLTVCE